MIDLVIGDYLSSMTKRRRRRDDRSWRCDITTSSGERVMNVTMDEAIEIYARASHKRFGGKARVRTQERIDHLTKIGDFEGAKVHEKVRDRIAALRKSIAAAPHSS
jgi:hypothetical protein